MRLEIDGATVDFPVAETGGIGTATTANLGWPIKRLFRLAALFGLLQRTRCSRRKHIRRGRCCGLGFRIVVVRHLHGLRSPASAGILKTIPE